MHFLVHHQYYSTLGRIMCCKTPCCSKDCSSWLFWQQYEHQGDKMSHWWHYIMDMSGEHPQCRKVLHNLHTQEHFSLWFPLVILSLHNRNRPGKIVLSKSGNPVVTSGSGSDKAGCCSEKQLVSSSELRNPRWIIESRSRPCIYFNYFVFYQRSVPNNDMTNRNCQHV